MGPRDKNQRKKERMHVRVVLNDTARPLTLRLMYLAHVGCLENEQVRPAGLEGVGVALGGPEREVLRLPLLAHQAQPHPRVRPRPPPRPRHHPHLVRHAFNAKGELMSWARGLESSSLLWSKSALPAVAPAPAPSGNSSRTSSPSSSSSASHLEGGGMLNTQQKCEGRRQTGCRGRGRSGAWPLIPPRTHSRCPGTTLPSAPFTEIDQLD